MTAFPPVPPVLARPDLPQALRGMTPHELQELATTLREFMVGACAVTGGHLGAGLGVVELTVALHHLLNSPTDKIIWDTGHQCYPHKLLTGRARQFHSLRQDDGLSGFPKITESEHDFFNVGHACTALSAAMGYAMERDLRGGREHVVAFVGDGSLQGGMAIEALNQIGHYKPRLLVVLNDNAWSIAPSVGALNKTLKSMRTSPNYLHLRDQLHDMIASLPVVGGSAVGAAHRVKEAIKALLLPGQFFEDLGLTYVGPINGHDLEEVLRSLKQCLNLNTPVVLHCVTEIGKGYAPAEEDGQRFHGVSAFDPATGKSHKKSGGSKSWTAAFAEKMLAIAAEDPRVVGITAAMPDGTGMDKLMAAYPKRFFDVGMAEQHGVTFCAGLAAGGLRPVAAIYSTFLQRGYDQVLHDVINQNLPVIFALDRAGIVGNDGETHQGAYDIAFLRPMPGITLMAPHSETELDQMLRLALTLPGPSAVRYPRGNVPEPAPCAPVELGRAEVLCDEGRDVVIWAYGTMVEESLGALPALREAGLGVTLVNARFAKPLDTALLLKTTDGARVLMTVEEGILAGGFGSAVLEALADAGAVPPRVIRLGINDQLVEQGSREKMLARLGLCAEGIVKAALSEPVVKVRYVEQGAQ